MLLPFAPFAPSYPFDRIKRLYDINVHGAFFTAREAARNMIPLGGGSIVLVASMSANVSPSDHPSAELRLIPHTQSRLSTSRSPRPRTTLLRPVRVSMERARAGRGEAVC